MSKAPPSASASPATHLYLLLEAPCRWSCGLPGARSRSTGPTTAAPTPGRSFAYLDLLAAPTAPASAPSPTAASGSCRRGLRLGGAQVVPDGHPHAGGLRRPGDGLPADGQHPRAAGRPRHRHHAGLTHELNNPATAAAGYRHPVRAPGRALWEELAGLAGRAGRRRAGRASRLVRQAGDRVGRAPLSPQVLRSRGRAGRLAGGARRGPAPGTWPRRWSPCGVDTGWLERVAATVPAEVLPHAVGVAYLTCDAGSLLEEVARERPDASRRSSARPSSTARWTAAPSGRSTSTTGLSPP